MDCSFFEINLEGQKLHIRVGNAHYKHRYVWDGDRRHCHSEYELHIVLSGKAQVHAGKEIHQLAVGSAMLIAPGVYHNAITEKGDIERLSMQILVPDGLLSKNLQSEVQTCRVFSVSKHLRDLCTDYYYETSAANPYRRELQSALLTQLLIGVFREVGTKQLNAKNEATISVLERMAIIDGFFGNQFFGDAKLEDLAARLYLSPRQVSRFLLKHYGMNYRELQIRARMDHAAWALRTTEQTIPYIAQQAGYRSESAFYKVFFKQYGITPQQYRRENKGE